MTQALKIGMIGLGGVSELHLEAYRTVSNIEVIAAAEPSAERLAQMQNLHGFRPYASHTQMIEAEDLDIVCVLSPVSTHAEIVTDCARRGLHILCEKPLTTDIAQAKNMIEVCQKHKVKLFYGASYRYLPAIMKAREIIQNGELGDIHLLTEISIGGNGPESQQALSPIHYPLGGPGGTGMGLVDHGIHLIDTFSWLMNSPVTAGHGRGNISGQALAPEYLHMTFANGAAGLIYYHDGSFSTALPNEGIFSQGAGWDLSGLTPPGSWQGQPGQISVYGTKAALRIFHYANEIFINSGAGMRRINLLDRPAPAQFAMQMEAFRDNILNEAAPNVTTDVAAEDGLTALRVLMSAYGGDTTFKNSEGKDL